MLSHHKNISFFPSTNSYYLPLCVQEVSCQCFQNNQCALLIFAIRATCSAHLIQFDLNSFFHSAKNSPQHFVRNPLSSFSSLTLTQNKPYINSNENTWPSVDLGAGWIILIQTGCDLNLTIDTARCETDNEQYKDNIRLFGNLLRVWRSSGLLIWIH